MSTALKSTIIVISCLCGGIALAQSEPTSSVSCAQDLTDDPKQTPWGSVIKCIQNIAGENDSLRAEIHALESKLGDSNSSIDARFDGLGKSNNIKIPQHGNGQTELCDPGYVMIGARTMTADGDHAGLQYGFKPICRLITK